MTNYNFYNPLQSISPMHFADAYKTGHPQMIDENVEIVFSAMTVRSFQHLNKMLGEETNEYVVFGLQDNLMRIFQSWHQLLQLNEVQFKIELAKYVEDISTFSSTKPNVEHFEKLYQYYKHERKLPIYVRHFTDGTIVKGDKIPFLTILAHSGFGWFGQYLETCISMQCWKPIVSATIAYHYYKTCKQFNTETSDLEWHTSIQCHDFHLRGAQMSEVAIANSIAHLLFFTGTDSLPAIRYIKDNYTDDKNYLIGCSVLATEHAIMTMHGPEGETDIVNKLLDKFPTGILSMVLDGFDFWSFITNELPKLKTKIMNREGTLVVRPDSGDPVKIICGDPEASTLHEQKGLIEVLGDIFGYTVNSKGYKQLDPHIGAIYGDSITPQRCKEILQQLKAKGWASSNICLGIGSYTYSGMNTRDTLGIAMKAQAAVLSNGQEFAIYKDPKTDSGMKKSHKGFLVVNYDEERKQYFVEDQLTYEQYSYAIEDDVFHDRGYELSYQKFYDSFESRREFVQEEYKKINS